MLVLLALLAFFAIALPDAMLGVAWPFMRISLGQPLSAMSLVLPFGVAAWRDPNNSSCSAVAEGIRVALRLPSGQSSACSYA